MIRSKLPKRFGFAGVAIGLGFMVFWHLQYKYNLFHFPTDQELTAMHRDYSPPALYTFIEHMAFTFVPGIWLGFFAMDLGDMAGIIAWIVASLINFPIYYCLGLIVSAIWRKIEARQSTTTV
jgi:hypothetical protein